MRALFKKSPKPGAELGEAPEPKPGHGEVLIRVRAASICGTDLHIYHWNEWAASRMKTPIIFGHECAGEIVEVGTGVRGIPIGGRVSVESHIDCGACLPCKSGSPHLCRKVQIVGVDRAGTFAEYLSVPARNAWINDSKLPWEVATILEPFGNAVHCVDAVGDVRDKAVIVSGAGPIGIMAVAVLRASGARTIVATDINSYRLDLALKMGATHVVQANKESMKEKVMSLTGGEGADVLLEMSGAVKAIDESFSALRSGGSVALLGLPSSPARFDLVNNIILKGATVHGIFGRKMFRTWEQVRDLIESGRVDLRPLVTHEFPLERFDEGLKLLESGSCGKVIFRI